MLQILGFYSYALPYRSDVFGPFSAVAVIVARWEYHGKTCLCRRNEVLAVAIANWPEATFHRFVRDAADSRWVRPQADQARKFVLSPCRLMGQLSLRNAPLVFTLAE